MHHKQIETFQPLYDRVLIRRVQDAPTTSSLIEVPDTAKEKPLEGAVLACGHGRLIEGAVVPLIVVPGDRVLFSKFAGTDVTLDGEELLILREEEILGRL